MEAQSEGASHEELDSLPRLSVAIMHAPAFRARRESLDRLIDALGVDAIREHTVGFSVVQDWYGEGPWPTGARAWREGLVSAATHHLVLQDDVVVCRDFLATMRRLIALKPDAPIVPFASYSTILRARRRGVAWARIPGGTWGQAVCLPRAVAADFLDWAPRHVRSEGLFERCGYDARLAMFSVKRNLPAWCTAPSLVEHTMPRSSTIDLDSGKVAAWYLGSEESGLSVDWRCGLDHPSATLSVVPDEFWASYTP